jgi:hypothetical protein
MLLGRWVGHVARFKTMRNAYKTWIESLKERDHLEDLGVNGRASKLIFGGGGGGVRNRIHLDKETGRFRILLITAGFHKRREFY